MDEAADKDAYNRGYRAGRKKTEAEVARQMEASETMRSERQAAWWKVYSAALQGLISSPTPWQTGGKTIKDMADYSELARRFADHAVRMYTP